MVESQLACESGFRVVWNGWRRADDDEEVAGRGVLSFLGKGILRRKGEGGGSPHVREKKNAENGGNLLQLLRQAGRNVTSTATRDWVGMAEEGEGEGDGETEIGESNGWWETHRSYEAYVKRLQTRRHHSLRGESRCLVVSDQRHC